ncbi:hypothetical protein [Escherichia coli]|uniref:BigA/YdbA N-terminal beta-barrel domain-containing protein n=1 Tax=Escherichia coli TaxID=562 RepID=UPI0016560EF1
MTSLKTSIKTITYLSDTGCLEIQGGSLVILDKTEKTLTIRDSVFTYTENADGTISLQDSNGRKATINLWQIDEANNTVALEGVSADGATKWQYNHNGELVITVTTPRRITAAKPPLTARIPLARKSTVITGK